MGWLTAASTQEMFGDANCIAAALVDSPLAKNAWPGWAAPTQEWDGTAPAGPLAVPTSEEDGAALARAS